MIVANILFAVMTIAARLAANEHVPWPEIGATRALVGALVAVGFALSRGARLVPEQGRLAWARSLFGTGAMLCTFYALGAPSFAVGDAATLFATSPLLIALLSPHMLDERPTRALGVLVLVAFVGVALVAGPRFALGGRHAAVALAGAVFSALAMIYLRRLRSGGSAESPESIALHFALVSCVVLGALTVPVAAVPSPRASFWLLTTGLAGGVAQLAMTRAYSLTEAARLGAVSYLGTVLANVGAIVFLGERATPTALVGTTLVVGAGVALAMVAPRPSATPARQAAR
jgi:drug/metabolite transporter (DMT)-like permease